MTCGSCQSLQLWIPCGPPHSDHGHKSCYISLYKGLSYHSAWTVLQPTNSKILSFNKYNSAISLSMQKVIKNLTFLDNHLCHINFPLVSLDFFSFSVKWTRSHQSCISWAFPHLSVLTSQHLQPLSWHKTNLHSQSSHFVWDVPNTNHILCSQHFRAHLLLVLFDLTFQFLLSLTHQKCSTRNHPTLAGSKAPAH